MFTNDVTAINPLTPVDDTGGQLLQFTFPRNQATYEDVVKQFGGSTKIDALTVTATYTDVYLESASDSEVVLRVSGVENEIGLGKIKAGKRDKADVAQIDDLTKARDRAVADYDSLKSAHDTLQDDNKKLKDDKELMQMELDDLKQQLSEAQAQLAAQSSNTQTSGDANMANTNTDVVNNSTNANAPAAPANPAESTDAKTTPTDAPVDGEQPTAPAAEETNTPKPKK